MKIDKNTLRKLNSEIGKLDTDSGKLFAGFVGRLEMSDRLYHGHLTFEEPGDDPPIATVSIKSILSPPKLTSVNPSEKE